MELEEAIKECERLIYGLKNGDVNIVWSFNIQAMQTVLQALEDKDEKIQKILNIIFEYGQIDGEHHKTWVIDQIVRILQGDNYKKWVYDYEHDIETGDTYTWEIGIAP